MELDFAVIAEKVDASAFGTLHLFGVGFDSIVATGFPAVLQFSIVLRFAATDEDLDAQHTLSIDVEGPNGQRSQITSSPLQKTVRGSHPERQNWAIFVLQVPLAFDGPGDHALSVKLDDREVKTFKLHIEAPPQEATIP